MVACVLTIPNPLLKDQTEHTEKLLIVNQSTGIQTVMIMTISRGCCTQEFIDEAEKLCAELIKELMAEGYSDRDADIIAHKEIYVRVTGSMAEKYNITTKKVEKIIRDYYNS